MAITPGQRAIFLPPNSFDRRFDAWVTCAGHFPKQSSGVAGRIRDDALICCCAAGQGELKLGGAIYRVASGQLFYIPPDIPHSYHGADLWEQWWVHFAGKQAERMVAQTGLHLHAPLLDIGDWPSWEARFEQLLAAMTLEPSSPLEITEALFGILFELLHQAAPVTDAMPELLRGVTYRCNSVDEMASRAGYSKYHYVRRFADAVGITPWRYVQALKIKRAQELLATTTWSIQEIAEEVQVPDPNYFSRLFRKHVGASPREFRDQQVHGR